MVSETTVKTGVSSLKSICQARLDDLAHSVQGLQVAIVAADNGFPLACINLCGKEGRHITTQGAILLDQGRQLSEEMEHRGVQAVALETEVGMILCRQVSNRVLPVMLMVVISGEAGGGYIQWSVRKAAIDLAESLNQLADSMPGHVATGD